MSRCVITKEVNHNVPHGRLRGYQPEIEDHFYDFDYVLVSLSGGKDSGILLPLCMDYIGRYVLCRKQGDKYEICKLVG